MAIPIFILASLNLLMVSSLNPNLLPKQIIIWFIALIFFWFGKQIHSTISRKTQWLIFFLSCFLLILPLIISPLTRGSKRWLNLGITKVQPSEIVKPPLMLFLANTANPLLHLIPIILVALQPDLGSAITLFSLLIPIIFSQSKLIKLGIIIAIIGLVLSPIIWNFSLRDYQKNRLITFINPNLDPLGKGYHTIQSKIAIGSAGIFGKGYKKGSQGQLLFLPEKHTDFFFAATVEELGLPGAILILLAYYLLIRKIIHRAAEASNPNHSLYCLGIAFLIWTQAFINIGMNIGILPVTGIPLPLLSVGGSSLISIMFSLGIAFSS